MDVDAAAHFGGGFTQPAALLIHGAVYLDEINFLEPYGVAFFVHGPVNLEPHIHALLWLASVVGVVRAIVHIPPILIKLHPRLLPPAQEHASLVLGIVFELGALESECGRALLKLWPIALCVVDIAIHIAGCAVGVHVVACPADIGDVDDVGVVGVGCAGLVLVRSVISDFVAVLRLGVVVFATGQLVPRVVGHTVAVQVFTHHDDARLAAATA